MKHLDDFLFYFPTGMRSVFATGVVMLIEILYVAVIAICCWMVVR
jgi:hypothetical protein